MELCTSSEISVELGNSSHAAMFPPVNWNLCTIVLVLVLPTWQCLGINSDLVPVDGRQRNPLIPSRLDVEGHWGSSRYALQQAHTSKEAAAGATAELQFLLQRKRRDLAQVPLSFNVCFSCRILLSFWPGR